MRFEIARAKGARWLLTLFGATANRSFVEVSPEALDVRFGFFHQTIPRAEVRSVSVVGPVPWYRWSLGWRTNLAGRVGLIGAMRGLVTIELTTPRAMFIGLPVVARELTVSLEEPERFVASVRG